MAVVTVTPCEPWTSREEIDRVCAKLCGSLDADLVAGAVRWASAVLYRLDGRRLRGQCTVTVSACWDAFDCQVCGSRNVDGWQVTGPIGPVYWRGWYQVWRATAPASAVAGACGCSSRCSRNLLLAPFGVVTSVERVTVNGTEEDPDGFRIVDRCYVERLAGPWPAGPIELVLRTGTPIPEDARLTASDVACYWLRAHGGAEGCQLDGAVTNITREELTLTMTSEADIDRIAAGAMGFPWVDRWLRSRKVPKGATVLTAADPPRWHTTARAR